MTTNTQTDDVRTYKVVINTEEQYSIWFADRPVPSGWREVGTSGSKQECLAYVKDVWADMRPLSLRKKMDDQKAMGGTPSLEAL
jgi:MbtH protein